MIYNAECIDGSFPASLTGVVRAYRAAPQLHQSGGPNGRFRAALSQNLKALEKQLNLKLLHRTTRDMSLTEEGQRLLEALAPALNAIEHAVSTLEESRHEPAGLLRINASRTAAKHFIEPHVGEFWRAIPD